MIRFVKFDADYKYMRFYTITILFVVRFSKTLHKPSIENNISIYLVKAFNN